MTRTVGIYLFDEVEVLDFSGPFEVFSTASRVKAKLEPGSVKPFNLVTLAQHTTPVSVRGGLKVLPDVDLMNHPALDVVIIPGGVIVAEMEKPDVIEWIRVVSQKTEITASVCTGAFLLAKAGLLDQKTATTHWEDRVEMQSLFPQIHVLSDKRWVDNGHVVTSGGISAGIGMSLHLVARLEGEELAVKTARQMEFEWTPAG